MTANFNDYILWSQSKLSTDSDILIVDGKRVDDSLFSTEFEYITSFPSDELSSWKPVLKNYFNKIPDNPFVKGVSPRLEILKNGDSNLLVKSHFTNTDETQRRIAFIFCSKGDSYVEAARKLEMAAQSLGLSLNDKDVQILRTLQYVKYFKILSIIVLIALVIWIIKIILN